GSSTTHTAALRTPAATTPTHTLSLHDALPISSPGIPTARDWCIRETRSGSDLTRTPRDTLAQRHSAEPASRSLRAFARSLLLARSEEHTSELQSRSELVCRLLLEKKKSVSLPG